MKTKEKERRRLCHVFRVGGSHSPWIIPKWEAPLWMRPSRPSACCQLRLTPPLSPPPTSSHLSHCLVWNGLPFLSLSDRSCFFELLSLFRPFDVDGRSHELGFWLKTHFSFFLSRRENQRFLAAKATALITIPNYRNYCSGQERNFNHIRQWLKGLFCSPSKSQLAAKQKGHGFFLSFFFFLFHFEGVTWFNVIPRSPQWLAKSSERERKGEREKERVFGERRQREWECEWERKRERVHMTCRKT